MPKTASRTKKEENKSWLGLLKYIFGLVMSIIGKNKQKDEIAQNQSEMQDKWDKIDEKQKEEFAEIDSMSLEDLKDEFNKK